MSQTRDDTITLRVLDDGTAVLEVDGISGANHTSAERLVAEFAALMGGEVKIARRAEGAAHSHSHAHADHKH